LPGNVVLANFRVDQQGRASGARTSAMIWNTYLIRDGRIARYREHVAEEDALATAREFAED
jgi:ketosteroid isomerase-like protein